MRYKIQCILRKAGYKARGKGKFRGGYRLSDLSYAGYCCIDYDSSSGAKPGPVILEIKSLLEQNGYTCSFDNSMAGYVLFVYPN